MKQIAIAILIVGSDATYWYAVRYKLMDDSTRGFNALLQIALLIFFLYSLSWS